MDDSPFNSSYFWSPVPTVQGQVETNSLLEMSWKFTWSSGLCYVKRSPEGLIRLAVSGRTLTLPADSDLTLFSLLLTLSDNYSLHLSLRPWKRECWWLREFIWWHEHFCFTSSTTLLPGFVNILRLTWLLSFLTFFSLHHHHIHPNHLLSGSSSQPITLGPTFCAAFFSVWGTFHLFFPMLSAFPSLIFIPQSSSSLHLVLPSFLICLILLSALLLHLSPFLPPTTNLPFYSSSYRWRTPCSWTKPRSSWVQRRPARPPSLTPPRRPPPRPTTPRLCSPFLDRWRPGPGCVWSPSRKEVGLPQEEAVVGATAAVDRSAWLEDTCTSPTPPRTSPLCLCPPRGSWLRVSGLFCPLSLLHLVSSAISISLSRSVCSLQLQTSKFRNTRLKRWPESVCIHTAGGE